MTPKQVAARLVAAVLLALIAWCVYLAPAITLAAIAALLTLGALYLYFIFFAPPPRVNTLGDITGRAWHAVSLGGTTVSGNGSEYAVYVKRGSSDNLIIQFSGGGACWDDYTASRPITVRGVLGGYSRDLKVFYFDSLTRLFPGALTGITSRRAKKNAFHDWNIVFLPCTTGDLHVGRVTNQYARGAETIEVHHNGRDNVDAALEWIHANFPEPAKILVAGESAGAWASAFYAPFIAEQYRDTSIYCLSDAAGLVSARWSELMDEVWQADTEQHLRFEVGDDVFEDALVRRLDDRASGITYLHSNTLFDDTLTRFGAAINGTPTDTDQFIDEWASHTKESMRRLSEAPIDYRYFLSDWGHNAKRHTTQHTLTSNEFYTTCEADGVTYAQWLRRNVIDGESLSLGRRLLD